MYPLRRYAALLLACLLTAMTTAGIAAEPAGDRNTSAKPSPKSLWASPPYITLSQRNADYVNSLPLFGSIKWTLKEIPHIDAGPDAGLSGAAMVRHNGAIYLAGGFIPAGDGTTDLSHRTSRWALRYDIKTGHWEKLPNMPDRKEYTRGIAHSSGVYVVGGLKQKATADGFATAVGEVYKWSPNSEKREWQTHSQLNVPRTHPSAGAIDNWLIVAAGNEYQYDKAKGIIGLHSTTIRETTEVFDLAHPAAGWQMRKPIPGGPRGWSGSAVIGDRFYLFGGLTVRTNSAGKQARLKIKSTVSYNPRTDSWMRHADAPFLISGWEGDVYKVRYVLLVGGVEAVAVNRERMGQNTWNDLAFAYDMREDRWLRVEGVLPPGGVYNDPGVVVDGDTIYVAGGEGPRGSHFNHFLIGKIHQQPERETATSSPTTNTETKLAADKITRHSYKNSATDKTTPYLLYHPADKQAKTTNNTPANKSTSSTRSLLIFLYGAGGSLKSYNIQREPYQQLRQQLAERGYYVLVPELGKLHFMNAEAKSTLDGIVAEVLQQNRISAKRVHVMGTSMGGGSSLAYAIHRPDMIRSVCAVMPMTDFTAWVTENPKYARPVAAAYGGTPQQVPAAYDGNSAIKQVDVFAKIPVMLVHGAQDRTVLFQHSQHLADRLRAKQFHCEFVVVDGLAHKDEIMRNVQIQAAEFFDASVK